jgi:hypothetical protein
VFDVSLNSYSIPFWRYTYFDTLPYITVFLNTFLQRTSPRGEQDSCLIFRRVPFRILAGTWVIVMMGFLSAAEDTFRDKILKQGKGVSFHILSHPSFINISPQDDDRAMLQTIQRNS